MVRDIDWAGLCPLMFGLSTEDKQTSQGVCPDERNSDSGVDLCAADGTRDVKHRDSTLGRLSDEESSCDGSEMVERGDSTLRRLADNESTYDQPEMIECGDSTLRRLSDGEPTCDGFEMMERVLTPPLVQAALKRWAKYLFDKHINSVEMGREHHHRLSRPAISPTRTFTPISQTSPTAYPSISTSSSTDTSLGQPRGLGSRVSSSTRTSHSMLRSGSILTHGSGGVVINSMCGICDLARKRFRAISTSRIGLGDWMLAPMCGDEPRWVGGGRGDYRLRRGLR